MVATKEIFYRILKEDREDNKWDFKEDIHLKPKEQFYELLKDILALSNSGGGHLLLGIKDGNHDLVGVQEVIDEADLGQKIQAILGYSIDIKLNYFKKDSKADIILGILYIPEAEKILTSSKVLTGNSKTIIQSDTVYVRRNTRSVNANGDDLEFLAYKIYKRGFYEYSEEDKKIIERNKSFEKNRQDIYGYLKDKFRLTSLNFSNKLNELYKHDTQYNKLEIAMLLGFEEDKIDDYFNGYRFPKIEHILRATEIFNLPI